jgi:hypothetical protein
MSQHVTRYPTNYYNAFLRLHNQFRQSLLLHDDLTLRFVEQGLALDYHRLRIVVWHEDGQRVTIRAASGGCVSLKALDHITRFLPAGYAVGHRDGFMLVRHPSGETTLGNTQTLSLVGIPR